jgi:hypothetical protein
MQDFGEFEMDENGQLRRKKKVLPDGATMHFPMGFYDHFADGSRDFTDPHRPGYYAPRCGVVLGLFLGLAFSLPPR